MVTNVMNNIDPMMQRGLLIYEDGRIKCVKIVTSILSKKYEKIVDDWSKAVFDIFIVVSALISSFSFITIPVILIKVYSIITECSKTNNEDNSELFRKKIDLLRPAIIRGIYITVVLKLISGVTSLSLSQLAFAGMLSVIGLYLNRSTEQEMNRIESIAGEVAGN